MTEADWRADLRTLLADCDLDERRRWLLLHRLQQGNRCHYCTVRFAEVWQDTLLRPTLDHVLPLSKGGEHSFDNSVAACWLCNNAKAAMLPEEARIKLPHVRVALLNDILRQGERSKRTLKRKRQRARAAAAKANARSLASATGSGAFVKEMAPAMVAEPLAVRTLIPKAVGLPRLAKLAAGAGIAVAFAFVVHVGVSWAIGQNIRKRD